MLATTKTRTSSFDDIKVFERTHADDRSPDTGAIHAGGNDGWIDLFARLKSWRQTPGHVDEDGFESPSTTAIEIAVILFRQHSDIEVPHRLVGDGEGGITIEYEHGPSALTIRISREGFLEFLYFESNRLVRRDVLNVP
jgi:hypothetical protein